MRRPVALMLRDAAHASRVYPTCALNPPISGRPEMGVRTPTLSVMPALGAGIYVLLFDAPKTWMPGTRPGMTGLLDELANK